MTDNHSKGGVTTVAVVTYWNENKIQARLESEIIEHEFENRDSAETILSDLHDPVSPEGSLILVNHFRRERDSKLRAAKLATTVDRSCEVCGFNFEKKYGERGDGYIEVHHIQPLHSTGPTRTGLADLALLCSNCHSMAHRLPWLTPDQLQRELQHQQSNPQTPNAHCGLGST